MQVKGHLDYVFDQAKKLYSNVLGLKEGWKLERAHK